MTIIICGSKTDAQTLKTCVILRQGAFASKTLTKFKKVIIAILFQRVPFYDIRHIILITTRVPYSFFDEISGTANTPTFPHRMDRLNPGGGFVNRLPVCVWVTIGEYTQVVIYLNNMLFMNIRREREWQNRWKYVIYLHGSGQRVEERIRNKEFTSNIKQVNPVFP